MASSDMRSTVDWLVDGARSTMQAHHLVAELCDRLVGCGIPLWRVAVFVRTLHPHIMGRRFIWRPGAEVEVREAPLDLGNKNGGIVGSGRGRAAIRCGEEAMKLRICRLFAIAALVFCCFAGAQALAQNAYITNLDANPVPVIATATDTVTATIPV